MEWSRRWGCLWILIRYFEQYLAITDTEPKLCIRHKIDRTQLVYLLSHCWYPYKYCDGLKNNKHRNTGNGNDIGKCSIRAKSIKCEKSKQKIWNCPGFRNEYVKQSFPTVPTQHIYFRCLGSGYVSKYYKRPGGDWKLTLQNQYYCWRPKPNSD